MKAYINAWKKYAEFHGRTSRRSYWGFVISNILVMIIISFAAFSIFDGTEVDPEMIVTGYQWLIFIPSVAIGVRRIHDVNKSGWFILIPIYNLILTLMKGTQGENRFGPPEEN